MSGEGALRSNNNDDDDDDDNNNNNNNKHTSGILYNLPLAFTPIPL